MNPQIGRNSLEELRILKSKNHSLISNRLNYILFDELKINGVIMKDHNLFHKNDHWVAFIRFEVNK